MTSRNATPNVDTAHHPVTPGGGMKSKLWSLIRLGRPKFLLGGLATHGLGALLAWQVGFRFDLESFLWGQLAVSTIQLMTHYSNDYFDLEADRANPNPTRWSGGSRVLVRAEIPRSWALLAAFALSLLAVFSITAISHAGYAPAEQVLVIFSAMLLVSWSYSSPPLRLHSYGLGELAVPFVVAFLTPLAGFVLQAGDWRSFPVAMTVPLALLQLAMLLTLQVPDREGDRTVGKRTWTVIFGVRPVMTLCIALVLGAFALGLSSPLFGAPIAVTAAWLALLPMGARQLSSYLRLDYLEPRRFNRMAFGATATFFLAVVADLVALFWAATDTQLPH